MLSSSGFPLVFLPGASGRAAVWQPIAKRLRGRREVILCDYPGCGAAPAAPNVDSLADLGRHLLERLPERFDLAALSMGGALALELAIEHPERIRKLVLVTTAGGIDVLGLGGLDWREAFREAHPTGAAWFLEKVSDLTEQLSRITASTLLVFGDRDLIAPLAVAEFLLERLASAKLEIVAGASHDLEQEYPDLLASLIEAHLRR